MSTTRLLTALNKNNAAEILDELIKNPRLTEKELKMLDRSGASLRMLRDYGHHLTLLVNGRMSGSEIELLNYLETNQLSSMQFN